MEPICVSVKKSFFIDLTSIIWLNPQYFIQSFPFEIPIEYSLLVYTKNINSFIRLMNVNVLFNLI